MSLGKKIQTLRMQKGMSQENLAEQVCVSRQAVSKWELDQSIPDLDYVIQISEIFGVSVDYLVKEDCENSTNDYKEVPNEQHKHSSNISDFLDNTVFTKFPFPICIPAFIICSMFGLHKGWNWFGKGEPSTLQKLPIPFIVSLLYLLICFTGIVNWHPAWVIFLLLPIYYTKH